MDNVTNERKQPVLKTLAIAGLFATVIFTAWLAIQIVQILPGAASSLASLANSVYNYNTEETQNIELASGQTMINVNEPFSISWKDSKNPGIYTFLYICQEGVTLDITAGEKNFPAAECNKSYDLGDDENISLVIKSEKDRFAEVLYKIAFFRTNATTASATYNGKVTAVNSNLFSQAEVATTTAEIVEETVPETVVEEPTPAAEPVAPVPVVPVTPTPEPVTPVVVIPPTAAPATPAPVLVPEYIYEIPQSQADSFADLLVSYLGIGTTDNDGRFSKTDAIKSGTPGAIQFSVHNIGQKTSEEWTFSTTLPGGVKYTSAKQEPLLPNERAVLTVEFPEINEFSLQAFSVKINTTADKNDSNNYFSAVSNVVR